MTYKLSKTNHEKCVSIGEPYNKLFLSKLIKTYNQQNHNIIYTYTVMIVKIVNYNNVSPPPKCNLNTSYAVVFGPNYKKNFDQSLCYIINDEIAVQAQIANIVSVSRDMIIN